MSGGLSPVNETAAEALFEYRRRMNDFKVTPESSALIVVDLQYGSAGRAGFANVFDAIGYQDITDQYLERISSVVVPNVQILQNAFRSVGAPIIFLTVGTLTGDFSDMPPRFRRAVEHWNERGIEPPYARFGTKEMTVLDEIAPQAGEPVIAKAGASGFTASILDQVLWNLKVRELVFVGVATNYCVQSTLRDAADRGFDCVLAEDACADVTPDIHDLGVKSSSPFCRVGASADIAKELTGQ